MTLKMRTENGRRRRSPARNQVGDDRNERCDGNYRLSDRNIENYVDRSRKDHSDGQPLFVDYDSTPIQGVTSDLPKPRLEGKYTAQITAVPALESSIQNVRGGTHPQFGHHTANRQQWSCLFVSTSQHDMLRACGLPDQNIAKVDSRTCFASNRKLEFGVPFVPSRRGHISNFVLKFVDNLQLHHMGDITLRASSYIKWKE